MTDWSPPLLTIRLFGPFEARVNGQPLSRLRTRKGQWLLALLVLRAGRAVERDWLAGLLWPESTEHAAFASLRNSLLDLRQALGPASARLEAPGARTLCLQLAPAEADVVAFDAGMARGDEAALEEAVALHRGPLLEGCVEEWAFQERQVREEAYLKALERLAAAALARGEPGVAEQHLRHVVAADPLRETAQRALMQALAASGNYAAATESYRELRLRLHRALNAEPDTETRALFEQIRAEARRRATDRPPTTDHRRPTTDRGEGRDVSSVIRHPSSVKVGPDATRMTDDACFATVGGRTTVVGRHPTEGTVTFLFTDIERSTKLWEEQGEAMRRALDGHDTILRGVIERSGGHVFKTVGDGCCAAFATAADAVAAAVTAQRALQAQNWGAMEPLRVRMALHSGAAEQRDGDYLGTSVNRTARLVKAGHGGQILLSLAAQALTCETLPEGIRLRDLGEHRLRDLSRPERIYQVIAPGLPEGFPALVTLDFRPNNLPVQSTPLIGREREREKTRDLLLRGDVRLVTLTGPGGTGKTRLALQVAAELIDAFPDGVFFVDLAPITDPALVATTIARTLDVRESGGIPLLEDLKELLRDKQMLLLLDNFEQILPAAAVVGELLAAAARLSVLVTSRAALHLRGEHEFLVPPLPLPDLKRLSSHEADRVSDLTQYAAVALFLQRAQAVSSEFVLTDDNAPTVAEICHRLDGLPLAIELAAARIKVLSPQALLSRLVRRLPLLVGGARDLPTRQQTLRDTIAWSYDLLNAEEQTLFRRLSVFVGGFTLEAAEAVTGMVRWWGGEVVTGSPPAATTPPPHLPTTSPPIDVLGGIASLVDKSLLRQEEDLAGESRFGMFETIREFGLEKLWGSAERIEVCERHRDWCLWLMEQPGEDTRGWRDRLDRERDNLRAALEWSLAEEGGEEKGLQLAMSLGGYWTAGGYYTEGREWLAKVAAKCGDSPSRLRASALNWAGWLAYEQGSVTAARALREEALAMARELGDRWNIAHNLYNLGGIALSQGDYATARALCEESLALSRAFGDTHIIGWSLNYLAGVAGAEGDYATARALGEESIAVFRGAGSPSARIYPLGALGSVAGAQGDYATARA